MSWCSQQTSLRLASFRFFPWCLSQIPNPTSPQGDVCYIKKNFDRVSTPAIIGSIISLVNWIESVLWNKLIIIPFPFSDSFYLPSIPISPLFPFFPMPDDSYERTNNFWGIFFNNVHSLLIAFVFSQDFSKSMHSVLQKS